MVISATLLLAFLSGSVPAASVPADAVNHYDVYRNGKKIGEHAIRFYEDDDGGLRVVAETNMKVKVLFITAYRYHYVSEETWSGGTLMRVATEVNDNGTALDTELTLKGDTYMVMDAQGTRHAIDAGFYTTNHWNAAVARTNTLFNTITGKLNHVSIAPLGEGTKGDNIMLTVRGDLDIDTRYDQAGNWLGMRFRHKDGSLIEFRCNDCRNTPGDRS